MGAGNQIFWDRRPCSNRIAVATQRVRRFSCERSSARMLSAYRGESAAGGWMAQGGARQGCQCPVWWGWAGANRGLGVRYRL